MEAVGCCKENRMDEQSGIQELKSERVQEEVLSRKKRLPPPDDAVGAAMALTRSQAEQRLKSERVQSRLKRMPHWRMQEGGKAIDRVRQFPDALVAASYLAFASILARQTGQPLRVSMAGSTLCLGLTGRSKGNDAGITEAVLDLAEQLG
jgi:pterin-4a-carbinolamine dehydratase